MAIDFARQVYLPNYNTFARPITVTPLKSQPNQPAYAARGIYATEPMDVLAEDQSSFSDSRPILDILDIEFPVAPLQGDQVSIPASGLIVEEGDFIITDRKHNGGGETTLSLKKVVPAKPW
jgi:hypothetical protein